VLFTAAPPRLRVKIREVEDITKLTSKVHQHWNIRQVFRRGAVT
jgi:hypothetical protein